ncbi:MAG: DNA-directed DNA polymerase [Candidatus Methanoperedens sp.]
MIIEQKDNYILTFSRAPDGSRLIDRCEFQPYFYASMGDEVHVDDRILNVEIAKKKSLFGEEVKKITVKNPYDVSNLRVQYYKTYEADIPFVWRYYIDRVKEIPIEKLRKLYLDIETDGMPDTQLNNCPITCIGFWDNYTEKYTTFITDKDDPSYRIVDKDEQIIHYCPTEYVLLSKFIDVVRELDPDMIIAHNGDRFDFPVIVGRLMVLSIMGYGRLSPLGIVKRDNSFGEWKTKCAGRILFDFLGAKTNFGIKGGIRGLLDGRDITVKGPDGEDKIVRIKRWSLEYLAQFVGMKKGNYEGVQTLDQMIEYNTQDVRIMVELDKFFNVTEYYHNMQMLIGCPYEATYFNTNMIDFFLMKRYSQFVFPTKPAREKGETTVAKIKGATVDEPIPGIYPVLYVVDQTSLYPTVVISANMSNETVAADGEIKLGNGISFTNKKVGIIADAVEFLLKIRLQYKEMAKKETDPHKAQMYDLISNGYKTLLVSFYGALLFQGFRLYQYEVAESIPYMGRVIKEHVRQICATHGYKVVYGDTDSTFLAPESNAIPIEDLVKLINGSFDKFSKDLGMERHLFNIELDKVFEPVIMADVAKRYVGYVVKKGKKIFKSVGFESVRRDTAAITEELQETVFKMILNGKGREEVLAYVKALKDDIKNGKYKMTEIMVPKGFSKKFDKYEVDSPWVRGCRYSNRYLGMTYDNFSDIGVIYVKGVPEDKGATDVVAIDREGMLDGFLVDMDLQIQKIVDSKIERILEIVGWGASGKQTTLSTDEQETKRKKFIPSGQMKLFSFE